METKVFTINYVYPGVLTFMPLCVSVIADSHEDAVEWIKKYIPNTQICAIGETLEEDQSKIQRIRDEMYGWENRT